MDICPGMTVRPTQEFVDQFPGSAGLIGTVQQEAEPGCWIVKWTRKRLPETLHASYLEPVSNPTGGDTNKVIEDVFVVVDADGTPFPQRGASREAVIAKHVSVLWSEYLDEFPYISPTLSRGRLSALQERAWQYSQSMGQRVVRVPAGASLAGILGDLRNEARGFDEAVRRSADQK